MRVALVCDFLTKFGGAQRVLLALSKIYPDAPIYCLLYDEKGAKGQFSGKKIIPSYLQKMPSIIRRPKFLFSRYPAAIENFDFSDFDLVISSSDSFAHGVITKPKTTHICYCHTPMRYAWDWTNEYLKENKIGFGPKGLYVRYLLYKTRIWDRVAADRVDYWIANSKNTQSRIKKYYKADSEVIYPPIDLLEIDDSPKSEDFYLIISRLEPYKNIGLAVDTFSENKKKLVIIGEGSDFSKLKSKSSSNISFLGWQNDKEAHDYLSKCKAFIFPGEDDFGMTPVEAMAAGKPVIALGRGGVLESVIEGKTGILFNKETVKSLNLAIDSFEAKQFFPADCRAQAEKFGSVVFEDKIKKAVEKAVRKGDR